MPFTVDDYATRLNKLLNLAQVEPPYYFAGGSYASYIMAAYNKLYPEQFLGAVMIDPPPFGYFHTMGTRWPKDFKTDDKALTRLYQFEQSVHNPMFERVPENVNHMKSYQQLIRAWDFDSKPIIVLHAKQSDELYDPPSVPDTIAKTMENLFANAEGNFATLSSNTSIVYSESDKHHLHISDRPLVIKSINGLVKQ